ncbi:glycosyltransferase [Lunatibacter salilacus]|uniref:glycosyltransferase n=1 Tax=Lunatibacter salilacus TaxID=2483804 RepID=UPI00131B5A9E|nr:glycosyltransferase [Lunatibacter salilacus]
MNIALVLEQPFDVNGGGVQKSTSKLAKIFTQFNHDVIIVSLSKLAKENNSFEGMPILYCDNLSKIKLAFKKYNTELVINQAGYSYSTTKILRKISIKIKIINTLRINPLNFYDNHKFILSNFFINKGLRILDNILIHKMILFYHISKQRMELGYIIKNTEAFVMLSEKFRIELYQLAPSVKKYDSKIYGINNPFKVPDLIVSKLEKKNVILHVGRLEIEQKRVDLLLEIWHKLHHKIFDWEFWVVGYGSHEEYMKSYCKKHGLDRVKFFGKQNPNEYYKQAKIFHLTSAFEGFGNVLVEAQSYGCVPFLFDSYAAASEIVNHNSDGFLVAAFDIENYVKQTLQLIGDKIKLDSLKEQARKNSMRFSYEKTYEKWDIVFNSLLD